MIDDDRGKEMMNVIWIDEVWIKDYFGEVVCGIVE